MYPNKFIIDLTMKEIKLLSIMTFSIAMLINIKTKLIIIGLINSFRKLVKLFLNTYLYNKKYVIKKLIKKVIAIDKETYTIVSQIISEIINPTTVHIDVRTPETNINLVLFAD